MTPPLSKFQPFEADDERTRPRQRPSPVADVPDGSSIDAHLVELRNRLRVAREERGACPPWDDLKADHAPGGSRREGYAARMTHLAVCHYCEENLREWKVSKDYASDRLEAVERGVARGIAGGAMGLVRALGRALPSRSPQAPRAPKPPRPEPAARPEKRAQSAGEEREERKQRKELEQRQQQEQRKELELRKELEKRKELEQRQQRKEQEKARAARPAARASALPEIEAAAPEPSTSMPLLSMQPRARTSPPAAAAAPMAASAPGPAPVPAAHRAPPNLGVTPVRLLVVEMADGRLPPESVFLCARVLGAEVAQVQSIEELPGDPDLPLVCGVILGGARPQVTWPDAVRRARRIVPRRPVLLLAMYGVETTAGARRTLGDALISEADPAERLLVALDPSLR